MKDQCAHHQFLEGGVMEQIQKRTDEVTSYYLRLGQLVEKVSSENSITNNTEDFKEIVLQELGDVKRGLERCVIETTECQGGLKELRAQVAAESLQHQEQSKVHAALVNNESLERQEQFKAHVQSMSETMNAKILESQELKTNTRLDNDTAVQESPRFGSVVTPRSKLMKRVGAQSPIRLQQNDNCVRATGSVQRVGGLVPPKAASKQSCVITPPFRSSRATQNLAGSVSATTSVLPSAKHGMQPREDTTICAVVGSATPRGFSVVVSAPIMPASARSFSAVPALITPHKLQNSSSDQISVLDLIDNKSRQHNCVAIPRAVVAQ